MDEQDYDYDNGPKDYYYYSDVDLYASDEELSDTTKCELLTDLQMWEVSEVWVHRDEKDVYYQPPSLVELAIAASANSKDSSNRSLTIELCTRLHPMPFHQIRTVEGEQVDARQHKVVNIAWSKDFWNSEHPTVTRAIGLTPKDRVITEYEIRWLDNAACSKSIIKETYTGTLFTISV